jgi:hypothetical protein
MIVLLVVSKDHPLRVKRHAHAAGEWRSARIWKDEFDETKCPPQALTLPLEGARFRHIPRAARRKPTPPCRVRGRAEKQVLADDCGPRLIAAFSLSFALSIGEPGATVMVYPPGWVTRPVGIFALTDRGEVFDGAVSTMLLMLATLVVLLPLARIRTKAAAR